MPFHALRKLSIKVIQAAIRIEPIYGGWCKQEDGTGIVLVVITLYG